MNTGKRTRIAIAVKNGPQAVVLRWDGDRTTKFVAEASPEPTTPAGGSDDAFDGAMPQSVRARACLP
jgi:hypothetical protein